MPLYFCLLLSLVLHLAMVIGPRWLASKTQVVEPPRIEVTLVPETPPPPPIDSVTTVEPPPPIAAPQPPAPVPTTKPAAKRIQGAALRRAQAALSEHLLYPPEAVRRELEGDVILLLLLDRDGRIQSIELARSSGHALLDQAAISAATRIGSLPGNPAQTLLPVSFRLQ